MQAYHFKYFRISSCIHQSIIFTIKHERWLLIATEPQLVNYMKVEWWVVLSFSYTGGRCTIELSSYQCSTPQTCHCRCCRKGWNGHNRSCKRRLGAILCKHMLCVMDAHSPMVPVNYSDDGSLDTLELKISRLASSQSPSTFYLLPHPQKRRSSLISLYNNRGEVERPPGVATGL